MTAKVCLCGIVKDEAKGIVRTLDGVKDVIDMIAIYDTGSSDSTPEIIEAWGKEHSIPVLVVRGSWPGRFDTARNRSLQIARTSGCEWLLEIDADWILQGNVKALKEVLAGDPKGDGFSVEVQTPVSTIYALRIKRASSPWAWRGPIHEESIWCDESRPAVIGKMDGVRFIYSNTTSDEQRNARYERDLQLLTPDAEAGDPRACFYLGQTLHCLGRSQEAYEWYLKRGSILSGPPGERAVALFRAGCLQPSEEVLMASFIADPSRSEPLWNLAFLLANKGYTQKAKDIAQFASKIPYPQNSQFVLGYFYDMFSGKGTNQADVCEFREKQLRVLCGLD